MSFSTYEVLLRRGNGINKTVYIHDCMSDQEARETAEAMYGMEVLRVLWRGRTEDFHKKSDVTNNSENWTSGSNSPDISFSQILGIGSNHYHSGTSSYRITGVVSNRSCYFFYFSKVVTR